MRLAHGCRLVVALALLGSPAVAASCASTDAGPVPSYRASLSPDAPRSFILFGDSRRTMGAEFWRGRYDRERLAVIRALADERPAFIVNTGDLVRVGSDRAEWRAFHEENEPIFSRRIPYFPGLGNHEYLWNRSEGLENFFASFPDLGGRKWYEIRLPPVLILVLDSNLEDLEAGEVETQDRWLSDTLAGAEGDPAIRHAILAFHHAPYTNCVVHGDSRQVQEHFLTRLTPKVHAVVTGHVHAYERFLVDGVQYVVSGGGGAPLMPIRIQQPRHPDLFRAPAYRPFHYCRFTIDGPRLVCDVIMLQHGAWSRVDGFECR
jgi:hypothetical protein